MFSQAAKKHGLGNKFAMVFLDNYGMKIMIVSVIVYLSAES